MKGQRMIGKYGMQAAAVLAVALLIYKGNSAVVYGRDALGLCYEMIIPTLFPFFVCSSVLVYSGFCAAISRLFSPVMRPLFGVDANGSAPFLLGIISGYPLGALTACQLYESSYLSKSDTEKLLAFCNNSGPLFILGSVGVGLYGSLKVGGILYLTHILAALTVGILFRFYKRDAYIPPKTVIGVKPMGSGELFTKALQASVVSILNVCGAVIFFSILSRILLEFVSCSSEIRGMLFGICEFTTGCSAVAGLSVSPAMRMTMTAFIIGFGGFSVHMQVLGVVSPYGLSLKPYMAGKLLHGLLAAVYTNLLVRCGGVFVFAQKNTAPNMWDGNLLFYALAVLFVIYLIYIVKHYFNERLER